jgi:RHS repeat-associated protein
MHAQYEPWRRVIYDVMNRPLESYDGVNATPTRFTYNQVALIRVQDPKNQVYKFAYNAIGWLERRYDAADTTKYDEYRYNRDGLLTEWRNRRASTDSLRYAYDVLHRLVAKTGRNTVADSFAFSTNGRQLAAWNAVARDSTFLAVSMDVDSVVTWLAGKRFRFRPHRNQAGALDSLLIASNNTSIVFPTRRYYRRTTTTQWLDSLGLDNARIRFTRNGEGLPTNVQLPTTPAVNWGRTFTSLHGRSGDSLSTTTLNNALGHGFGYDSLGRLRMEVNPARSYARAFAYDSLGRLTVAMLGPTSGCAHSADYGWTCTWPYDDTTRVYQYDAVGNRLDHSGSYGTGNRIQSFDGKTFGHDGAGNMTWQCCSGGDTTQYFWSAEGRLDSVKVGSMTRVDFAYDAGGRLVRRSTNGSVDRYFLWDGVLLLAELNATATARVGEYAHYPGIDHPLALITGSTTPTLTRYFLQDPLGNVLGVVKDTFLHQKVSYDEWGKQLQTTGTLADTNRLRWKGLLWDGAAGVYYMRARWYDPRTARFLSEDPSGLQGGINYYSFAAADPINARDPSGLDVVVNDEGQGDPSVCEQTGGQDYYMPTTINIYPNGNIIVAAVGRYSCSDYREQVMRDASSAGSGGRGAPAGSGGAGPGGPRNVYVPTNSGPSFMVPGALAVGAPIPTILFLQNDDWRQCAATRILMETERRADLAGGRGGSWFLQRQAVKEYFKLPGSGRALVETGIYTGLFVSPQLRTHNNPLGIVSASGRVICGSGHGIFMAWPSELTS